MRKCSSRVFTLNECHVTICATYRAQRNRRVFSIRRTREIKAVLKANTNISKKKGSYGKQITRQHWCHKRYWNVGAPPLWDVGVADP